MVLLGLAGLRFDADGVRFQPCLPEGIAHVELRNVNYRKMGLDITIRGGGTKMQEVLVNGKKLDDGLLAEDREGRQEVTIRIGKE
jgi:cellobiose phosphorylase